MERYSTKAVGLSKDKHLQPCALTCTQGGGRMWLTRLPRMEAASVITSLQVSQRPHMHTGRRSYVAYQVAQDGGRLCYHQLAGVTEVVLCRQLVCVHAQGSRLCHQDRRQRRDLHARYSE